MKIIYDRAEDMVATTKRHPSRTRHRTGVTRDGKLVAMDIDFVIDGGAYATLSSVVLSRGTIHAAGPYSCPNVRVRSQAVATNAPPHGAFRGFGAPQSIFAIERHMDQIARAVNLTPEEFRRRNFLHKDQTTATGQMIHEDVNFDGLLDRAFRESDYHAKRERFARENPGCNDQARHWFCFLHARRGIYRLGRSLSGVGGGSWKRLPDGMVRILAASTEIGQGTNTIFSQIAADALGIGYDRIEIAQPDTGAVPNSGPTVASRTSMVVGKLVETAALALKQTLVDSGLLCDACTEDEFVRACRRYIETRGPLRSRSQYEPPPGLLWDDATYSGDAYGTYAWAVYVAEVAVDTVTFEARVTDFVAVQEVGKVIHPVLAAGQIEGGVAQAIGMALYENVVWREGRMANGQMTNYIMPTAADIPPIRVFFEETSVSLRPGRRKRNRRIADGWSRAGDCERHRERHGNLPARNSRDAGSADGSHDGEGGRAWLRPSAKLKSRARSTASSARCKPIPMARLLDVLREEMHLTGTKEGCGEGECGACAVLMNGAIVNSCLVPAIEADGAEIRTIEGIANGEQLHAVQEAFLECGGAQCGICTPGMVIAAVALLERHPIPSDAEIREGLAGNLCRCTGLPENLRGRCAGLPIDRRENTPENR